MIPPFRPWPAEVESRRRRSIVQSLSQLSLRPLAGSDGEERHCAAGGGIEQHRSRPGFRAVVAQEVQHQDDADARPISPKYTAEPDVPAPA